MSLLYTGKLWNPTIRCITYPRNWICIGCKHLAQPRFGVNLKEWDFQVCFCRLAWLMSCNRYRSVLWYAPILHSLYLSPCSPPKMWHCNCLEIKLTLFQPSCIISLPASQKHRWSLTGIKIRGIIKPLQRPPLASSGINCTPFSNPDMLNPMGMYVSKGLWVSARPSEFLQTEDRVYLSARLQDIPTMRSIFGSQT